ncbi:MAG: ATP-dependent zinc protease [Gloeocapsa sp. DLM2.Bin57]|nr:MAG: ATP-dependent zinc protease [Gloeocapsa sp. DLM2.Bin57]
MIKKTLTTIGWREIIALPELNIPSIKAKIDTGARTSALHAFHIQEFYLDDKPMVSFQVHPHQKDTHHTVTAIAELLGYKEVRNSGGHLQNRPVIKTKVEVNGSSWKIEVTLTNRDLMGFRMLLGRQALRGHFIVDPGRSFLLS